MLHPAQVQLKTADAALLIKEAATWEAAFADPNPWRLLIVIRSSPRTFQKADSEALSEICDSSDALNVSFPNLRKELAEVCEPPDEGEPIQTVP
jgi:hypothetical protein